ncbi:MAG TPA: NAD(P)H-hydrate dehydratase [Candidatus Monoglobus merdigallinarum]|uniref:Multifunctional fusion protein n=1 Tax=Candidatus Monoglobus merdigallinarum TaxID=2838698 RepID=A0A9D1PPA9_9FIRM|nr:NAD(P)H-hydrate dehydratase [Candidatus Monoglobus merdigallinarum]
MIGIDTVEIDRFRNMKNLEVFIRKVFTAEEAKYFVSKTGSKRFYESIAGHFAAKEAFAKALGTGVRGFNLSDVEICHDGLSKPYIKLGGVEVNACLSISHSETDAVAVVYIPGSIPGTGVPVYADIASFEQLLPQRSDDAHKGDCGRALIIGGSRGMTGAPCLAALGAMRCGSGLVTVGLPKSQQPVAAVKLTEAMTLPLPENETDGTLSLSALGEISARLNTSDVCVFGPGLARNDDIQRLLESLLSRRSRFVIDADGLYALSRDMDILRKHKNRMECEIIITPHEGEMSRLCGIPPENIRNDREGTALRFAEEFGVITVLKGRRTVTASPDGRVCVNSSGNSGMATGGMGDVLSGVIASFWGQGAEAFEAAALGAFVHGVAGDLAASDIGERGILASDLAQRLPEAIRLVSNAG